jgi:hypothetical protein
MMLTSAFSATLVMLYQLYFVKAGVLNSLPIGLTLALGGLEAFGVQSNIHIIERRLAKWGVFVLTMAAGVFYLLFAFAASIYTLMPFFVLAYAFADAKKPLISAYQNEQIDSRTRATAISLINMVTRIYVALMGIALGWVANFSLSKAFAAIGLLIVVSTFALRVDKIAVHLSDETDFR